MKTERHSNGKGSFYNIQYTFNILTHKFIVCLKKVILDKLYKDKFYSSYWVLDSLDDISYNMTFRFYPYLFESPNKFSLLKFEGSLRYLETSVFFLDN